jgi:hypothetical protein
MHQSLENVRLFHGTNRSVLNVCRN